MSRPRRRGRDVHGVLLLDKPQGASSNDVLQKVKRLFNANRAGHTGALDPLATGMLPVCLGEATKFSQYLLDSDKRYRVIAKLGQRTDTPMPMVRWSKSVRSILALSNWPPRWRPFVAISNKYPQCIRR
jgi:tRNA pseudouridine(55) synthase